MASNPNGCLWWGCYQCWFALMELKKKGEWLFKGKKDSCCSQWASTENGVSICDALWMHSQQIKVTLQRESHGRRVQTANTQRRLQHTRKAEYLQQLNHFALKASLFSKKYRLITSCAPLHEDERFIGFNWLGFFPPPNHIFTFVHFIKFLHSSVKVWGLK